MDKMIITHKCRTCLKTSSKLYPLTKPVTECTPNITYAQLLKNYAQFEFHTVHELHLPQYLCFLCSSQLKSTFVFVQQAQQCNVKLLNDLSKQFCLREQEIDLPELQDEASVFIKESPGSSADLDFTKQICLREEEIHLPKLQDKTSISIEEQSSDNHADLEDQDVCSFTASEDNSSRKNNLVTNTSFIEETMLTTDQIIEYDSEDYLDTNKSVMTTEQIIEYDFTVTDEMDNDSFTNETNEDTSTFIIKSNEEAFLSNKTDTLESVESLQGPVCNELIAKNDKFSKERRETILSCEICLSIYNNKSEYIKHVNEKHKNEQANTAAVLENSVENQSTDNKKIKCRLCDYSCKTKSSLQYHKRSKHGTENDRIKCKFCSYTTLNKPYLFNHVKNFHKEIIQTLKANTIDNSNKSINSSTNNILNNNCFANDLITIPEDDKTTSDNSNDEQDKEEFIEEDDEAFIRNIINMKKIKRKKKLAPETLLTRCEDCGKILKNYKTLYSHRRYVHRSEDMLSSCSYCDKKFKRVTDLNIHIRQIHGPVENRQQPKPRSQEKRFMCAECSYTCRTSNLLNTHIRIHHTGEKPYKCNIYALNRL